MALGLTVKEGKFIAAYLQTGNLTSSMIAAGYSAFSASAAGNKMLKKPKIANELAKLQNKVAVDTQITLAELVGYTRSVIQNSLRINGTRMTAPKEVLRGTEILAKLGGFFVEQQDTEITIKIEHHEKEVTGEVLDNDEDFSQFLELNPLTPALTSPPALTVVEPSV